MDAVVPFRQGGDDASPTGSVPILATVGPVGGAQRRTVALDGTSRPSVGRGPSGRPVGAGEGPIATLLLVRQEGPEGHAVVATVPLQGLLRHQASPSPAGAAATAWTYRRPTRQVRRIGARGRRARTSLAVRRRPRRLAAQDEVHSEPRLILGY